jgi:hypothetical protein
MKNRYSVLVLVPIAFLVLMAAKHKDSDLLNGAEDNSQEMIHQGREVFRFDTFGDQAFWGGQLKLHQTINKLTPKNALTLGLKVDAEALPTSVVDAIKKGKVNLDDPAVTRLLIKNNAVLGVVGFFDTNSKLQSVGLTCGLCHSTVDDSVAPGIGHRIDGLANRDLNVGAIIAAAPNIDPIEDLLELGNASITTPQVRQVLNS